MYTFFGTGTQQTTLFRIRGCWRILRRGNVASRERQDYILLLKRNDLDPRSSDVKGVCELTTSSGVEEMYGAGLISLYLISGSEWMVQVQEWQQAR
jgi:hypothetical protein